MTATRTSTGAATRTVTAAIGATALLVSGWVHAYLYFRGGYRGIAPESVAGLTISRSFVLQAVSTVVVAEIVVVGLMVRRLLLPGALAGIALALGSLVAYALSRTSGLLGFTEAATTIEAVIAVGAELVAVAALGVLAASTLPRRR